MTAYVNYYFYTDKKNLVESRKIRAVTFKYFIGIAERLFSLTILRVIIQKYFWGTQISVNQQNIFFNVSARVFVDSTDFFKSVYVKTPITAWNWALSRQMLTIGCEWCTE